MQFSYLDVTTNDNPIRTSENPSKIEKFIGGNNLYSILPQKFELKAHDTSFSSLI